MSYLADSSFRGEAITSIDRSVMVEAGAGAGKTSILAARIVKLLAAGKSPKSIAAVTFTEAAASELMGRVRQYVELATGKQVPKELAAAFPDGISATEKKALKESLSKIGLLTITTIHGFCQRLIKPYPVEANIDPGASIIAGQDMELMFEDVFEQWVRERLSLNNKDLLTSMIVHDANKSVPTIKALARALRGAPHITVEQAEFAFDLAQEFLSSALDFINWHSKLGYGDNMDGPREIIAALRVMHQTVIQCMQKPAHEAIISMIEFGLDESFFKLTDGQVRKYTHKGKYQKAAGNKAAGEADFLVAEEHFSRCGNAFLKLRQRLGSVALCLLVEELKPLLDAFQEHKRAAAVLDFDDLLNSALRMLKDHPQVRKALSDRYQHILVDEFQDTDPIQSEIFMLLTFEQNKVGEFTQPRPGALFLVGDFKQAIYRFRGADVGTYLNVRDRMSSADMKSIISIFVNFRSQKPILDLVNQIFEPLFSASGQPGFTALNAHHDDGDLCGLPAVAWFEPSLGRDDEAGEDKVDTADTVEAKRFAEAYSVADICQKLIGRYKFKDKGGIERKCQPGDIALLVPQGTDLYIYENALEERQIPVSAQAGKGLFRQQEVQDLIAITRALADERDTLALGAFLRGPLIGFTEQQLLDQSNLIPNKPDGRLDFLTIGMDTSVLTNERLRWVIDTLTELRQRSVEISPHDILSEAVAVFKVRANVRSRFRSAPDRRLANIDRFLDLCSTYNVRGLRAFSDTIRSAWEDGERSIEGRPDHDEDAVSFITMHSAKGLEWPVVIPVNTMTSLPKPNSLKKNIAKARLTMPFFDLLPCDYEDAVIHENEQERLERYRLLYVALTRARNLLLLSNMTTLKSRGETWASFLQLPFDTIPKLDLSKLPNEQVTATRQPGRNAETHETFEKASQAIAYSQRPRLNWISPSKHEWSPALAVRTTADEMMEAEVDTNPYAAIKGGPERGVILHKLMEEVLTGELKDTEAEVEKRALELVRQVVAKELRTIPDLMPEELARCVMQTLALPIIAEKRKRLLPEVVTASCRTNDDDTRTVIYGVVDAVEIIEREDAPGTADMKCAIDWKSDPRPSQRAIDSYKEQVGKYLETKGIEYGLIVFMSTGQVVEVRP